MAQTRVHQLQIPVVRPNHSRSTSTSSIPIVTDPFVPEVSTPNEAAPEFFSRKPPQLGLDAPPNTSQAFSGMVTPVAEAPESVVPSVSMTTMLVGDTAKPFKILTDLLTSRSSYFRELLGVPTRRDSITNLPTVTNDSSQDSDATLSFPALNEFAFALFNRWLYGAQLPELSDSHSMQHYLALYVLADRFKIEKLQNEVMDVVQSYYRTSNMAAPPYRLEYLYANTSGTNTMRAFLVSTAAYGVLTEGKMGVVMKEIMGKGGELTEDFLDALIRLHVDGMGDVRVGGDCQWHSHEDTKPCRRAESGGVVL